MSITYIGLKMGSNNTLIYKAGNGLVLKEASLIAMPTNPKNKEVFAVGENAKKIKDRLPENIAVYSPISNGVVQYEELAILMLKNFIKKVFPNKTFAQNIRAIVCTPIGITPEEKKALELTCYKAGIADVYLVPEIICQSLGLSIDTQNEKANMIVDIGGDITDIAIISNNGIISAYNLSIGGSLINSAIIKYINETYKLVISSMQAEHIKIEIGSLIKNYHSSIEVYGYNYLTNSKETITISSSELYPIISHYYGKIAAVINSVIQTSEPQVISDINENGIYFVGEASLMIGLDKFFQNKTSFKINTSANPNSNMIGIGELIKYPQILHKIMKKL